MPGLVVVGAAVVLAVLLIARPTHDMPVTDLIAPRPPSFPGPALVEPAPAASPALALSEGWTVRSRRAAPPARSLSLLLSEDVRATPVHRLRPLRDGIQSP